MSKWMISGAMNHLLIHDDMRNVEPPPTSCLIVDPEWDLWNDVDVDALPKAGSVLVFTSPAYFKEPINVFGAPTHVFAWDCRAADMVAKNRPMRRVKNCLWYGERNEYQVNGTTYGKGKRLQELYVEESISTVVGDSGHSYAKPVAWIKCLIGNTSRSGIVYDPFAGSGTTLWASESLYRPSVLVERDENFVDLILSKARSKGLRIEKL